MSGLTRSCLLFFLLSSIIILAVPSASAEPIKKSVLVLFPYQNDLPNHEIAIQALREEFGSAEDLDLDMYYEYFELMRFPNPVYQQQMFDLLAVKYQNKQIDLVTINSKVLLNLWLAQRGTILPDTPVVFYSTSSASIEGLQFPHPLLPRGALGNLVRNTDGAIKRKPGQKKQTWRG